jgi:uncharacterized protein YbjT (DUF2867 family)
MTNANELVLIVGATGTVGTAVTKALIEKNANLRLLVRDVEKAKKLFDGASIDYVVADAAKPETIDARSLQGVTRAFLLLPNSPKQVQQEVGIAKKIVQDSSATLKQIVKLSVIGANATDSIGSLTRLHGEIENTVEQLLRDTSVAFTVLRPTYFNQNHFGDAQGIKNGQFYRPGAADTTNYKYTTVDVRDIADIAAVVLTEEPSKHADLSYNLTGPETRTPKEYAQLFGEVLGKEVQYIAVDDAGFFGSLSFLPEFYRWYLVKLLQKYRSDAVIGIVAGDYEIVTGKKPRTLKAFIEENKNAFL